MNIAASPKLRVYAALAAVGLVAGLALGRPEPAILAAPFLIALAIGLSVARIPQVRVGSHASREHEIEGDEVEIEIVLQSALPVARLEVAMSLPEGLESDTGNIVWSLALAPGVPRRFTRVIRCRRWGGYTVGDLFVRVRDPFGFVVGETRFAQRLPLRVYPAPEALRALVSPEETQHFAGNERSKNKGDGLEFVDVRPYTPGDRLRSVNWRLSTRSRELHVNEFHREENTDVILFLDSFVEVRHDGNGTHEQAVRAAAALAERYLERRDRVGLIGFGGVLRWLRPGMGVAQRYRIVETLIDTDVIVSFAWKRIDVIPAGTLPPKSLILALTPLLDERSVDALFDLRARRFDLAVVEISPIPFIPPPTTESEKLALRLWELEREELRNRFRELGVPVAVWNGPSALDEVLLEVQTYRRFMHRAHA